MNARTTQQFVSIAVALLVAAGLATVGTAQVNDPNVLWEPSDRLAPTWQSVTLAITAYNPAERPDIDPLTRKHAITVAGKVDVLDANDLIAVATTNATAIQAFDEIGDDVFFDPNAPEPSLARTWELGEQPKAFAVELHLDPGQTFPQSLSELDFTVDGLYGQPFSTAMIPLKATDEWTELSPRYHVRVAEANLVDDACYVVIEEEIRDPDGGFGSYSFDPNDGPWEETVRPDGQVIHKLSGLDFILRQSIVDADGNAVRRGGYYSYSLKWAGEIWTGTATFNLHNCKSTEELYVYYTFAIGIYETPIQLTLTDIPVLDP